MTTMVEQNVADGLYDLLDGSTWAGLSTTSYLMLTVGFSDTLGDTKAAVQIVDLGGVKGYVDRTDRIQVDVYAEGEGAQRVGRAIADYLVPFWGGPVTMGDARADSVVAETTPHPVPYASDRINLSSAVYRVVTRPVEA